MTYPYPEGTLLRYEFANGTAIEGYVRYGDYAARLTSRIVGKSATEEPWLDVGVGEFATYMGPWLNKPDSPLYGVTATVLRPAPRPDEPQGLGAAVEADLEADADSIPTPRREWVRLPRERTDRRRWHDGSYIVTWDDLIDPVVLSEGWTP